MAAEFGDNSATEFRGISQIAPRNLAKFAAENGGPEYYAVDCSCSSRVTWNFIYENLVHDKHIIITMIQLNTKNKREREEGKSDKTLFTAALRLLRQLDTQNPTNYPRQHTYLKIYFALTWFNLSL